MIIQTTKELRPRDPDDHYPTPEVLCYMALMGIPGSPSFARVLDPGCGDGVWGQAALKQVPTAHVWGIDTREVPIPEGFADVTHGDFLSNSFWPKPAFNLICGNPPYRDAERFIRKSLTLLRPDGYLVFLLRLAFLEGQARMKGLWREHPPFKVAVCGARPSFTGNGKTDATAYAVFYWYGRYRASTPILTWLDWKP
jgi:SAM-dependent methyltransferase